MDKLGGEGKLCKNETLERLRGLSAAALIGFSMVPVETIHAAEDIDGKSWVIGSQQMFEQARFGDGEKGAVFVLYEDNSGQWIPQGVGGGRFVNYSSSQEIQRIQAKNPNHKKYKTVCQGHTHSLTAAAEAGVITGDQFAHMQAGYTPSVIVPPSGSDLTSYQTLAQNVISPLVKQGDSVPYTQMTISYDGVFYYEPATKGYLAENYPEVVALRERAAIVADESIVILRGLTEGQAERFGFWLQQKGPNYWHVFSEVLEQDGSSVTAENVALLFFTNARTYFINPEVIDLLDISDAKKEKLREYIQLENETTEKGVQQAQVAFAQQSMQHAPTEVDFQQLYIHYAKAGWALSYKTKAEVLHGNPCDSGIVGNE